MDEIDEESSCSLNTMFAILFYVDVVFMFSKSWSSLQSLFNKLYELCNSSSLDVNLSNIKIMMFGCNKRKLIQEAFYLGKDQIEITHE